jgi:hypothetical protein
MLMSLDGGVHHQDAERVPDLLRAGAAADVEEVRRLLPASLMMSIVAIASLPLTTQPMVLSSLM